MDSALMILFTAPTEITPDPSPSLVMNYDSSCLPIPTTPTPAPTPVSPQDEDESGLQVNIPPREGGIGLMENNITLQQAVDLILGMPTPCSNPNNQGWCTLLEQVGDIFTYSYYDNDTLKLISVNRTSDGIVYITHVLPSHITYPNNPSWGKVNDPNNPNHYRLAFSCTVDFPYTHYHSIPCYWDSDARAYFYYADEEVGGDIQISPDGQLIARVKSQGINAINTIDLWNLDLETNNYSSLLEINPQGSLIGSVRWSDADTLYFVATFSPNSNYVMHKVQNIKAVPTITPIFEMPNLQPFIFDVTADKLIYWSYDWNDSENPYDITYHNVWSHPRTRISPTYWSPYGHINNKMILIEPSAANNANIACIELFDVTNMSSSNQIACLEIGFQAGWASGIDLSALDNQLPPTPTPTPPPSQFTCLNPDPYAPPADTINLCIQELAEYGIIVFADGLPTQQPQADTLWSLSENLAWTAPELQQLLIGVQNIAKAFNSVKNGINDGTTSQAKAIFRTIMGDPLLGNNIYILRVTGNFTFRSDNPSADGCYPSVGKGCTSNISGQSAIVFYAQFYNPSPPEPTHDYIQHVVVHEFGHRFDGRVGFFREVINEQTITRTFFQYNVFYPATNSAGVRTMAKDCGLNDGPEDVFGIRGDAFARGIRGWGTIKASGPPPIQQTYFQLNPWEIAGSLEDLGETTADMFLNWVYRRITAGPATWVNCTPQAPFEVGTWSGFRNIDSAGNYDSRLPGNARYKWIEDFMIARFDEQLSTNDNINYVWSPKQ